MTKLRAPKRGPRHPAVGKKPDGALTHQLRKTVLMLGAAATSLSRPIPSPLRGKSPRRAPACPRSVPSGRAGATAIGKRLLREKIKRAVREHLRGLLLERGSHKAGRKFRTLQGQISRALKAAREQQRGRKLKPFDSEKNRREIEALVRAAGSALEVHQQLHRGSVWRCRAKYRWGRPGVGCGETWRAAWDAIVDRFRGWDS